MSQVYLVWLELNHWVEGQYLCHRSICLVRAQSLGCRPVVVSVEGQVYLVWLELNHWVEGQSSIYLWLELPWVEGQYLCHRSILFG